MVDGNVKVQSINFRGNKVQLTINGTLELQQTISNTSSLIPEGSTVFLNGTLQIDAGTTLTWQGKSLTEPPPLQEYSGGQVVVQPNARLVFQSPNDFNDLTTTLTNVTIVNSGLVSVASKTNLQLNGTSSIIDQSGSKWLVDPVEALRISTNATVGPRIVVEEGSAWVVGESAFMTCSVPFSASGVIQVAGGCIFSGAFSSSGSTIEATGDLRFRSDLQLSNTLIAGTGIVTFEPYNNNAYLPLLGNNTVSGNLSILPSAEGSGNYISPIRAAFCHARYGCRSTFRRRKTVLASDGRGS